MPASCVAMLLNVALAFEPKEVMAATHTLIRQRKTKGLQHDTEAYSDRSDGSGVGGSMGKTRERQIVVKTDRRLLILELGDAGKFQVKSSGWDENRVVLEGDVLEVAVRNGRPTCSRSRRNDLRGTPRSRRKALRNRTVVLRGRRSRPSSRAIAARHSNRRRRHRNHRRWRLSVAPQPTLSPTFRTA